MEEFITWAIVYGCGVLIGVAGTILATRKRLFTETSGTIKIETSDPDGPFMFLELRENLPTVINKKRVLLDVEVLKNVPHN